MTDLNSIINNFNRLSQGDGYINKRATGPDTAKNKEEEQVFADAQAKGYEFNNDDMLNLYEYLTYQSDKLGINKQHRLDFLKKYFDSFTDGLVFAKPELLEEKNPLFAKLLTADLNNINNNNQYLLVDVIETVDLTNADMTNIVKKTEMLNHIFHDTTRTLISVNPELLQADNALYKIITDDNFKTETEHINNKSILVATITNCKDEIRLSTLKTLIAKLDSLITIFYGATVGLIKSHPNILQENNLLYNQLISPDFQNIATKCDPRVFTPIFGSLKDLENVDLVTVANKIATLSTIFSKNTLTLFYAKPELVSPGNTLYENLSNADFINTAKTCDANMLKIIINILKITEQYLPAKIADLVKVIGTDTLQYIQNNPLLYDKPLLEQAATARQKPQDYKSLTDAEIQKALYDLSIWHSAGPEYVSDQEYFSLLTKIFLDKDYMTAKKDDNESIMYRTNIIKMIVWDIFKSGKLEILTNSAGIKALANEYIALASKPGNEHLVPLARILRYCLGIKPDNSKIPDGLLKAGKLKTRIFFQEYYKELLWRQTYINKANGYDLVYCYFDKQQPLTITELQAIIKKKYQELSSGTYMRKKDSVNTDYIDYIKDIYTKVNDQKFLNSFLSGINKGIQDKYLKIKTNDETSKKLLLFADYLGLDASLTFVKQANGYTSEINIPRAPDNTSDFKGSVFSDLTGDQSEYSYIIYNGHAGMGATLDSSFSQSNFYNKNCLIQLANCWSMKEFPKIQKYFPLAQAVVTKVAADSNDGCAIFRSVCENILKYGDTTSWNSINQSIQKSHQFVQDNYILPNMPDYEKIGDIDGDGITDDKDTTYDLIADYKFADNETLSFTPLSTKITPQEKTNSLMAFLPRLANDQGFLKSLNIRFDLNPDTEGNSPGWFWSETDEQFLLNPKVYSKYKNADNHKLYINDYTDEQDAQYKIVNLGLNIGYANTHPFLIKMGVAYEALQYIGQQYAKEDLTFRSTYTSPWKAIAKDVASININYKKLNIPQEKQQDFFNTLRAFVAVADNLIYIGKKDNTLGPDNEYKYKTFYEEFCKKYNFTQADGSPMLDYDTLIDLYQKLNDDPAGEDEGAVYQLIGFLTDKNAKLNLETLGKVTQIQ